MNIDTMLEHREISLTLNGRELEIIANHLLSAKIETEAHIANNIDKMSSEGLAMNFEALGAITTAYARCKGARETERKNLEKMGVK